MVGVDIDLKFPFEFYEIVVDIDDEKKVYFYAKDGTIVKEFPLLKDEQPRDAVERIYRELNPSPNPSTSPSPSPSKHENKIFDKEIKKAKHNIKNKKIVLIELSRGVFYTASRIKKNSKIYKQFIENKNTLSLENPFYIVELKGHILTTQHKKAMLSVLNNAKTIDIDKDARIIIYTTARAVAVKSGFCTRTSYSKNIKEYAINILKELCSTTVSVIGDNDKKNTYKFVDEIRKDNNDLVIVFSKKISEQLYQKDKNYLLFLPKNLSFNVPALIFDTVLYFKSQTTSAKSNNKISLKKIASILHVNVNERYRIQDCKQMYIKFKNELEKNNIFYDPETETLQYIKYNYKKDETELEHTENQDEQLNTEQEQNFN